MLNKKLSLVLILVALLTFVPACGGKKIKTEGVTGTVTLDGQPLPYATVYFIPAEGNGHEASGVTNENGEYKLQTLLGKADAGTTPGKYLVKFDCYEDYETGRTSKDEDGNDIPEIESRSIIPSRYNDPKTSGFEAEVASGSNRFDFDLRSK
ncbi:MAG: carboxypeptidase-like regulatory domain-containing protein [Thermoguttaceae bacterium]|jgi:hypothetical protein|nr:carboxypeptidase-like regulatory domain-containing protein [Thermoguttaceae bacterium]